MSQADNTSPPAPHHHTDPDPSQDVPAALTPPSAPKEPSLIAESLDHPQSTEETAAQDTAATTSASEGPTDQPEPDTDAQVVECDQPVSLEPDTDAAEGDVEVCMKILSSLLSLDCLFYIYIYI